MLSFSPIKLGIVVVVAMVLLGPDKIPHAARKASETLRAIQQFREKIERELRETVPDLPSTAEIARMARSPVTILNRLTEMPSAAVAQAKRDLGAPSLPLAAPVAGERPSATGEAVASNPRFFAQPEGPAIGGPVPDLGAPPAVPPVWATPDMTVRANGDTTVPATLDMAVPATPDMTALATPEMAVPANPEMN
jgi:Sec-independent protein translocase protein TatA